MIIDPLDRRKFCRTLAGLIVPIIGFPAIIEGQTPFSQLPVRSGLASVSNGFAPKTNDWAARVVANGGASPSNATLAAVDTWYNGLVTDAIDSQAIWCSFIAPDNLIASITPFYKVAGNDPATNHNFVSGDLTTAGLAGDTSSKYLQLGVNVSNAFSSVNEGCYAWYGKTVGAGISFRMNAYDGVNMAGLYSDGTNGYIGINTAWTLQHATGSASGENIFLSGSRAGASSTNLYEANSVKTFLTLAGTKTGPGTRPNLELYAFCWNQSNVAGQFPANPTSCSFIWIGHTLSTSLTQKLYNRTQTLRQAFGGGYT